MVAVMQNDIAQVEPSARSGQHGRALSRSSTTPSCGSASGPDCALSARSCSAGASGARVEIGSGTGLNLPPLPRRPRRAGPGRTGPCDARPPRADAGAQRPSGPAGRRAGGAAAVRRRIGRHGRLDLRAVHGRRSRSRPAGDRAGACGPTVSCSSSSTSVPSRRRSPPGRTAWPSRGVASRRGCRCNRATAELIATCGLELEHVHEASWHGMPPIVRPLDRRPGTEIGRTVDGVASGVGLFPPARASANGGPEQLRATLARAAAEGVDHLCVGDHVSFFVGAGSDGLITATSLLAAQAELPVYVGLYLLPLRHPVAVARQLATTRAARAWSAHARRRDRRRGPPRDRDLRGGPEDTWTPDGRMPADPARPGRRHAGHASTASSSRSRTR